MRFRDSGRRLVSTFRSEARRYAVAFSGQFVLSGFHLVLTLLLIQYLTPSDFGIYSVTLVFAWFQLGISNALASTPLSVYRHSIRDEEDAAQTEHLFTKVALLLCVASGVVVAAILLLWLGPGLTALFGGLFVALFGLRQYMRAFFYALDAPSNATRGDLIYVSAGTATIGTGFAGAFELSVESTFVALSLSSLMAVALVDARGLVRRVRAVWAASMTPYKRVWRESSSWSLLGVASTEGASNSHSYLVPFLAGPEAFAVIAASRIVYQPLTVAGQTLTKLERPRVAANFFKGSAATAHRQALTVCVLLVLSWAGLSLAVVVFWDQLASWLFAPKYDLGEVEFLLKVWAAIMFLGCVRSAASLVMQASMRFRQLALANMCAAPVTLIAVALALYLWGPMAALLGTLAGQVFLTALILRLLARGKVET